MKKRASVEALARMHNDKQTNCIYIGCDAIKDFTLVYCAFFVLPSL